MISRIETGERPPTDELLQKIAPVLGINVRELKRATFDDLFSRDDIIDLACWIDDRKLWQEQRTIPEFWTGMNDVSLDFEVARLMRDMGYAELQRAEGGGTSALMFERSGKKTLVYTRCNLSEPAIPLTLIPYDEVRKIDLLRQLVGADDAIFVAPGGFERGIQGKLGGAPVRMLSAEQLAALSRENKPLNFLGGSGIGDEEDG
jgi:transcriptional regulator with XRE-family HTH domain